MIYIILSLKGYRAWRTGIHFESDHVVPLIENFLFLLASALLYSIHSAYVPRVKGNGMRKRSANISLNVSSS